MVHRLTKQKKESAEKLARKMHKEMLARDPEYARKWNAMLEGVSNALCDPDFEPPKDK